MRRLEVIQHIRDHRANMNAVETDLKLMAIIIEHEDEIAVSCQMSML